jgi:hypothetical protein
VGRLSLLTYVFNDLFMRLFWFLEWVLWTLDFGIFDSGTWKPNRDGRGAEKRVFGNQLGSVAHLVQFGFASVPFGPVLRSPGYEWSVFPACLTVVHAMLCA